MSLKPAAVRLGELLKKPVAFASDCIGPEVEAAAKSLKDGDVLLLENLRFHAEEEKNVPEFAKQLAVPAEVYVDDAFGSAHRAHGSTEGITHFLSPSAAGLLMQKELEYLGKATEDVSRPYIAIVGGAKVSDKIELLQNFLKIADTVLVGGAMAYTFLRAEGIETGKSRTEDDKLDLAKTLLAEAKAGGKKFLLPTDHIVADKFDASAKAETISTQAIPMDRIGLDIGPATRAAYTAEIAKAKTIVWNGPMGVFEMPQFAEGTLVIAKAVAASSAISIVGGGDSVAAVKKMGVADKVSHISTGGGASLEFLSGITLPGVAALTDKS
jgi:phosphoglycerate kinase